MNRLLVVLAVIAVLLVGGVIWVATRSRTPQPAQITPAGAQAEQQEPTARYQEK